MYQEKSGRDSPESGSKDDSKADEAVADFSSLDTSPTNDDTSIVSTAESTSPDHVLQLLRHLFILSQDQLALPLSEGQYKLFPRVISWRKRKIKSKDD